MGRLRPELLERIEKFADRMLDVAESLEQQRRFRRVVDQIAGCGSSAGANTFEADFAMSRQDFAKTMNITTKELNESRFWLRLIGRRAWIKADRLAPLLAEAEELLAMTNAMVARTRRRTTAAVPVRERTTPSL